MRTATRSSWRRWGGGERRRRFVAGAALAAVLGPWGSPGAVTLASDFPTPVELEPAVRFWVDVFTRHSREEVILHDSLEPGLVYRVVRTGGDPGGPGVATHLQAVGDSLVLAGLGQSARAGFLVVPEVASRAAEPGGPERVRAQRGLREAFADALVARRLYRTLVEDALAREALPSALAALPLIESSYLPATTSEAGAMGLWQLTRETGRRYLRIEGGLDERRDPVRASAAASRHLRELRAELPNWPLAITAYNRGLAGVERARRAVGSDDLGVLVTRYRGPGFGFASRNYYAEFLAALHVSRHAERYFPDLRQARIREYRVKRGDTLHAVARRHGTSIAALRVTNGLRSAALQPGQRILVRL